MGSSQRKYVFVTGGVSSSLGKGICAASIGRLFVDAGLDVRMVKCDPYLNVDPGTMNPFEHGECYVTADSVETDLDLGHYERFVGIDVDATSNVTCGSVYTEVLANEREGAYLGRTVQVIPHVTDRIKERIIAAGGDADVLICEVGGTVGDIEILPFLEALRQFRLDVGVDRCCYVHVTLVPGVGPAQEQKTKPTQHSVSELRSRGITPDVLLLRTAVPLEDGLKAKVSRMCDVEESAVCTGVDADELYAVPLNLADEGLGDAVAARLGLDISGRDSSSWAETVQRLRAGGDEVRIGVVGKYAALRDAYLSVLESLRLAGGELGVTVISELVGSDTLDEDSVAEALERFDGLVIPGGFGDRGIEGKVAAARWSRENGVPCLGICLGMQIQVIDVARHLCEFAGANSTEFDENSEHPVVCIMAAQRDVVAKGATMRLGAHASVLTPGSKVAELYGSQLAVERHRHRFEVNPHYRRRLEEKGLVASGVSPDGRLVEFVELVDHPFWVGTQAHPEFTSRPGAPNPLFAGLVDAAHTRSHAE